MLISRIPRLLSVSLLLAACALCSFSVHADEAGRVSTSPVFRYIAFGEQLPILASAGEAGKRQAPSQAYAVVLVPAGISVAGQPAFEPRRQLYRAEFLGLQLQMVYTEIVTSCL